LPLAKIKELTAKCSFIGNLPSEGEAKDFWAGGYRWKVNKNVSQLSTSDYITLTEYTKTPDRIISNLPEILYIFCKPKYYMIQPSKEKSIRILEGVSIGVAYSLAVFFCHLITILMQDTKPFLENKIAEIVEMEKKKQTHSMSNGVGT
jgi:hypothetical protein